MPGTVLLRYRETRKRKATVCILTDVVRIRRVEATDTFFKDICNHTLKQLGVTIVSVTHTVLPMSIA